MNNNTARTRTNDDDDYYQQQLESIERIINEIEAIQLIFEDDDEDPMNERNESEVTTRVLIKSEDEYNMCKEILQSEPPHDSDKQNHQSILKEEPLSLKITLETSLEIRLSDNSQPLKAVVHFALCIGSYPINTPAITYIISIDSLNQTQRDEIATDLNKKAKQTIGSEALLDLIQDFQNIVVEKLKNNQAMTTTEQNNDDTNDEDPSITHISALSRRWIWVHHITNKNRCADIVEEANSLSLSGFLKSGYPGVIIIEGTVESCDALVHWIKGNKSRPGGFGRNWGHHVRGQIDNCEERRLKNCSSFIEVSNDTDSFYHLGEDLKAFAAACKECGVEDEFLAYVMQH